jgi:hypothetical protein
VDDEGCEQAQIHARPGSPDGSLEDRRFIDGMRHRLRDRQAIVTSWQAIRQSRDLLARFVARAFSEGR